eukprot:TRINITY_DN12123_c0_g1_i2.p1 TRINITY_DN12123_c0_g1~~TRINITY_DN12123_c0_g1_i2.p1  ORF type:complete len:295 (-),score=17.92 TRINITY_DN12123_c0_g1_i2:24-908(-)
MLIYYFIVLLLLYFHVKRNQNSIIRFYLANSLWFFRKNVVSPTLKLFRKVFSDTGFHYVHNDKLTLVKSHPPRPKSKHLRLVCLSDIHTLHDELSVPDGDVLIICGDLLYKDRGFTIAGGHGRMGKEYLSIFNEWLDTLPHPHKIIIGGNHDQILSDLGREKASELLSNAKYLEHETIYIDGFVFHGCPWSPSGKSPNKAFKCEPGSDEYKRMIDKIPEKCDVLISHVSPLTRGAKTFFEDIKQKNYTYSIAGHMHAEYGIKVHEERTYLNCSCVNRAYVPFNPPVMVDLFYTL